MATALAVAVQDLLCELRVDRKCLEIMANGYSPDYPGVPDCRVDEEWENPHPKVQISAVTAQKLLAALPED